MNISTPPLVFDRDIRHLGPDDGLSAVSITNVTRQLAERDFSIVTSFNALLAELRASVSFVPVVLPRTSLPAMAVEYIGNFRIPAGYTAAILNTAVASVPVAGAVKFEIIHSAGTYGQSGVGENSAVVVETTSEYASTSGAYYTEGEFVFRFTSSASRRASVCASVLITLRQA